MDVLGVCSISVIHCEKYCVFHWRETGDDRETPHVLSFWLKALA